jgi:hypothetical protein
VSLTTHYLKIRFIQNSKSIIQNEFLSASLGGLWILAVQNIFLSQESAPRGRDALPFSAHAV